MMKRQNVPFRLALASMPWSIFNRPSIQLAALKAYLDRESEQTTDIFHPYLAVAAALGGEHYHHLALHGWAGEALFAPLLFPEQYQSAEQLFYRECKTDPNLKKLKFSACLEALDDSLDKWIGSIDLNSYSLFGFSICFNQLLPSLTAAKRIKTVAPDLPIVIGGSGCVGEIGNSLLQTFPQVDYVIDGEGETPLLQLCKALQRDGAEIYLPENVSSEKSLNQLGCSKGISDLEDLPVPDYNPYFKEMLHHFPANNFIPVLPVEFSRGCWWNKCKFCNLNLQWRGYRWKTADRMLKEVVLQGARHKCLDFCFTDNALPPKETDFFFRELAKKGKDYDFFAELRIITSPKTMPAYRRGGLTSIQVGIESLSTSLLKKMDKGSRCIENIAAMRQSAEAGIVLDGNLICEFPGSTGEEVEETLFNLDFVLPYAPLSSASFFLGHGSPVAENPRKFGITAITQHPKNRMLFPKDELKKLTMLIKGYRGQRGRQQTLWKPVYEKIKQWREFHADRSANRPALTYRDGGDFLLIHQEQVNSPPLRHRLQGTSRDIYIFCRDIRDKEEILANFPKLKETTLLRFLEDLRSKKLLFREEDYFLSLAIRISGGIR